jgi:hypothetical protein
MDIESLLRLVRRLVRRWLFSPLKTSFVLSFFFSEFVHEKGTGLEIKCILSTYTSIMRKADDLLDKSLIVLHTVLVMADKEVKEKKLKSLSLCARVSGHAAMLVIFCVCENFFQSSCSVFVIITNQSITLIAV